MADKEFNTVLRNYVKTLNFRFPVAQITKDLGYTKGQVSQYLSGKIKASVNFITDFENFYDVDLKKFMFDGDMSKDGLGSDTEIQQHNNGKLKDAIYEDQEIPLYDIEVTAGVVTLFKTPNSATPIDTIKIPNMPKCDGAITVTGDSMYPLIKSGDIVFYKAISDLPASIFYGNMYIVSMNIEGDELVMIKYIKEGKDSSHVLLVSENQHHANKQIHIKHINGMALVKGSVRFNFAT